MKDLIRVIRDLLHGNKTFRWGKYRFGKSMVDGKWYASPVFLGAQFRFTDDYDIYFCPCFNVTILNFDLIIDVEFEQRLWGIKSFDLFKNVPDYWQRLYNKHPEGWRGFCFRINLGDV